MLVNGNHLTTIWYEDDLDEVKIITVDGGNIEASLR